MGKVRHEDVKFSHEAWRASLRRISAEYVGGLKTYAAIRRHLIPSSFFGQALDLLPEGGRVCDVGCGIGLFTMAMAVARPNVHFTGVELNEKRVIAATAVAERLGIRNVAFEAADLRKPSFSSRFDAVLAIDLLHHLPADASRGLLAAVHASLQGGGLLIVKEIDTRPGWKWLLTYLLDLLMAPNDRYGYFSLEARRLQLSALGFDKVVGGQIYSLLPYPHILVVGYKK